MSVNDFKLSRASVTFAALLAVGALAGCSKGTTTTQSFANPGAQPTSSYYGYDATSSPSPSDMPYPIDMTCKTVDGGLLRLTSTGQKILSAFPYSVEYNVENGLPGKSQGKLVMSLTTPSARGGVPDTHTIVGLETITEIPLPKNGTFLVQAKFINETTGKSVVRTSKVVVKNGVVQNITDDPQNETTKIKLNTHGSSGIAIYPVVDVSDEFAGLIKATPQDHPVYKYFSVSGGESASDVYEVTVNPTPASQAACARLNATARPAVSSFRPYPNPN